MLVPFLDKPVLAQLDSPLRGQLLRTVGLAHHRLGEVEKAIGYHEQALVISREIGDRRGEGSDLGNLGLAYAGVGEVEKAAALLQQAKVIGEQIGDPRIVQATVAALESLSKPE